MSRLTETTRALREAEKALDRARTEVHAAIVEDHLAGRAQKDIAAESGYSPAQVRNILRAAGIEPSDRYKRAAETARRKAAGRETPSG